MVGCGWGLLYVNLSEQASQKGDSWFKPWMIRRKTTTERSKHRTFWTEATVKAWKRKGACCSRNGMRPLWLEHRRDEGSGAWRRRSGAPDEDLEGSCGTQQMVGKWDFIVSAMGNHWRMLGRGAMSWLMYSIIQTAPQRTVTESSRESTGINWHLYCGPGEMMLTGVRRSNGAGEK